MESQEQGSINTSLKGKTVVFAGTLANEQVVEAEKTSGCKVLTSISKGVDFVVVGENAGQQADEAKSMGIRCLTETEWSDVINDSADSGPSQSIEVKNDASTKATDKDQVCLFSDIPDVALIHVFQYLPMCDLINILTVCERWNELIEESDYLWRKFIPNNVDPPANCAKGFLKSLWTRSIKIGKERWLPDVSRAFRARMREMDRCSQWGFGGKDPMRAGATLYQRLNPTYDFVEKGGDPDNTELLSVMKEVWEKFNKGQPYFRSDIDSYSDLEDSYEIESEKDVMKKSRSVSYSGTLEFVQGIVEPSYATERYAIDQRDLDGFSHLSEITADSPPPYNIEVSDDEDASEDIQMLQKHYKPPELSIYKETMGIIFGEDDTKEARKFSLNDGCFNENYEYSYTILIGPYAVLYESRFYDL
ncbi:unnamed protein product [Owenia fusiformis]|uniref:Uncharacterized protein n=1 Tax=Owenia fusiformis TaxID=6347 RepID=A0A8J1TYB6_OWEFU|nr:unnamed protein product [Owenia fusiformis]